MKQLNEKYFKGLKTNELSKSLLGFNCSWILIANAGFEGSFIEGSHTEKACYILGGSSLQ